MEHIFDTHIALGLHCLT